MARVDKYDPITGGFRAHIAENFDDTKIGKLYGWGIDANGKAVIGAGQSGVVGVWVVTERPGVVGPLREVSRIDIMREGCITDFCATADTPGVDVGVAGTKYFCNAAGEISTTGGAGTYYVGCTVEPDRLEVNFNPVPA